MTARQQHAASACLIVLAAAVAFYNVFPNAFHLDDFYRVAGNPGIQQVHPIWRHFIDPSTMSTLPRITAFRPLLPLTLSLNYWWGGDAPASYHAVNLALHAASSVLVYVLFLQLGKRRSAALIAALLFAVHPLSGIVVNYISARDLALSQMFLLASLVAYTRMRLSGRDAIGGWVAAIACAGLALLSKTNAAVLPVLIAAFELIFMSARWRAPGFWLRIGAFAAVPLAWALWTRAVIGYSDLENTVGAEGGGPAGYALAQARAHLVYFFNFAWPVNMRQMPLLTPPAGWVDPAVALTSLIVAASLIVAWRVRRTQPLVAFCIVAYWVLMAPESSVVPLYHLRSDYRPYPSSAFLFAALAFVAVTRLPRAVWLTAAVAAVVALTATSIRMNRTWRTEESLWTRSTALGGDAVAHLNLAMAIADRRDPRVKANLERSLALAPGYVLAHIDYGLLLMNLGKINEGLAEVREGVRLAPAWGQSHYWLSVAYESVSMTGSAADEALLAYRLEPNNLQYAYDAARRAQAAGRLADSLPPLGAVVARNERYGLARFLEGFALQQTGAVDEAIASYRRFLAFQPDYSQAHFNLAYALMTKGRCAEALPEFARTLELRPDYREVDTYLARCRQAAPSR
ncbi:MAG TPA: tetratricopeptide repeat protein [Vicinamibacterales bacterium]